MERDWLFVIRISINRTTWKQIYKKLVLDQYFLMFRTINLPFLINFDNIKDSNLNTKSLFLFFNYEITNTANAPNGAVL